MIESAVRFSIAILFLGLSDVYANEPLECLIEPHVLIDVSSSEIGVLASVPVEKADTVSKGEVVAALHTDVENAALAVSRTRASSKSEIDLLLYDYEYNIRKRKRLNELQLKQMVSAQDIDEVQTAQDVARLRLKAANEKQQRSELEAIRDELALARRIVLSPINGVVVNRYKSPGEFVDGDPILQLAQLNPLRVELVVPIAQYGQIEVGMQAKVSPEMPITGPFVATVTHIDPIMDAATATFGVRLSLPNPNHRLPPGLRCSLVLLPKEEPSVGAATPLQDGEGSNNFNVHRSTEEPSLGSASPDNDTNDIQDPVAVNNTVCQSLGPISDSAIVDKLTNLLITENIKFEKRKDVFEKNGSPWTVLSRLTHSQPQEIVDRAKRAGISDLQWFKRGPNKHRFSFGRFRDKKNATNRASQMRELEFEVEIQPTLEKASALWLDLVIDSDASLLTKITPEMRTELTLESISCPQALSW